MNYWIFVHSDENVDKTFLQLVELKNWGFKSTRPIKNRIASLQKGDIVVFYLGGPNCKYFSGEAKLTSSAHSPTRQSIGGPKNYEIDSMVDFDGIDLWNGKRIYLTSDYVREKLRIVKNKDNWGMTFGQSIISITEKDYKDIKAMLNE